MQAKIVKGQLVITLPLQTQALSASGKTLIVASLPRGEAVGLENGRQNTVRDRECVHLSLEPR